MSTRRAQIDRTTGETRISLKLKIDGKGKASIDTGIPFFDHMLALYAKHSVCDLTVKCDGDLDVDLHHTVEDTGIALGQAYWQALSEKRGIRRYGTGFDPRNPLWGEAFLPMDETLARVVLDLSGRACLVYEVEPSTRYIKELDVRLFREFFQALTNNLALNLHIDVIRGEDVHHVFEGVFKVFARALDCATSLEPREKGVPTTKGMLD